jgi:hypothetical protein
MFPLTDDDEDIVTSLDGTAFTAKSYVGAKPQAESVADAVRGRHDGLSAALRSLEQTCESFDVVDVSAGAAQNSLRKRVGSVAVVCLSLESVASFVENPECESLFAGDGLLAPYLAGTYLWAGDVIETLGALARDLNDLAPNWSAFRERLNDVAWIFEMAVTEGRQVSNVVDVLPAEMCQSIDDLLVATISLKHRLDEPFG